MDLGLKDTSKGKTRDFKRRILEEIVKEVYFRNLMNHITFTRWIAYVPRLVPRISMRHVVPSSHPRIKIEEILWQFRVRHCKFNVDHVRHYSRSSISRPSTETAPSQNLSFDRMHSGLLVDHHCRSMDFEYKFLDCACSVAPYICEFRDVRRLQKSTLVSSSNIELTDRDKIAAGGRDPWIVRRIRRSVFRNILSTYLEQKYFTIQMNGRRQLRK